MSDFEQSILKQLRGWLLIYVLAVAAPGTVWHGAYFWANVTSGTYGQDTAFRFLAFAAFAINLYLIIWVKKRVTREYTIWLNLILACVYLALEFLSGSTPSSIVDLILGEAGFWYIFWITYWMRSERVKKTYCQKADWIP